MYTLIAFATQWGSKHGGINSFNADFLTKFGDAYHHSAQIICIVSPGTTDEAVIAHVTLVPLPYVPKAISFDASIGEISVDLLRKAGISFEPHRTIWLGHDLITGEAAISAAKLGGGRSAVIHHMSYDDYESYAANTESAQKKTERQAAILKQADLVFAIGPLLCETGSDLIKNLKSVQMLVPGLPEIDPKEAPKKFVAFLGGRLSPDAARIKQGHLGVAAFAAAQFKARTEGVPEALKRQPKLILRGVDFEHRSLAIDLNAAHDPETELKEFTEEYAKGVVNLHALPYTEDRGQLYTELSGASVALMPSWHEGFGLIAWEAIAAGVPLIIGENTGVYRLLDEVYDGAQTGYVYSLEVSGTRELPYFRPEDLEKTVNALRSVALDPAKARKRASQLRNTLLEKFPWTNCCEQAALAFGWDLQIGSVPDRTSEIVQEIIATPTSATTPIDVGPLRIPRGHWRVDAGMADSQLLRAEEEVIPFDVRRQPEADKLMDWIADTTWPVTVRLVTGDGGQGKTRLAIHLCQQLRTEGWQCGFIDSSLEANRMPLLWRDLSGVNQPILIVVDYAETRQSAFLSLLKSAIEDPGNKSVRMLLLARDGGEWWDNLASTNSFCEALLSGPATTGPFRLLPLYAEHQDRQQAFNNALKAFARILQVEKPGITPELVGDQFQRPLFVQMAALLALYGERPTTIQGLTKALLNHERRYWVGLLSSFNWPDAGRQAEQLLALATLAGGFPTAKVAEPFWNAARGIQLTTSEFNSLFRKLAALYHGSQGLQPLRPDLLGEALVAQALLRSDGEVLLDAVLSSSASQYARRNALTVLGRMSNERADIHESLLSVFSRRFENCAAELVGVCTETASRLPEVAELAFERLSPAIKNQVAGSLRQSLPQESVQLAKLSCCVFGHITERTRQRLNQKPNSVDRMVEYADALDSYGTSLFQLCRYDESREVSHNALSIMRKLLSRDRSRFEGSYAGYLFNYAQDFVEVGKDEDAEDALSYSREALEIRGRLVKKDADLEPEYANSLDQYACSLGNVGRKKEALAHSEQAVNIYRKLNAKNGRFEDEYAEALNNYSVCLSDTGEIEKALTIGSEALAIRERLKQRNPDRFEPPYATSLANYAAGLVEVGRPIAALKPAREAYLISRRLAEKHPQRFGVALCDNFWLLRSVSWLCDDLEDSVDEHWLETVLLKISEYEQTRLKLKAAFIQACVTNKTEIRVQGFRYVLSTWPALSQMQKLLCAGYWYCASAWCEKFDSLKVSDWRVQWRDYLADCNGNVAFWLREVARRLEFEFPTDSEAS